MTLQALFRYYAQALTDLLEEEGIVFRAYADPLLPYFSLLSNDEQQAVVDNIRLYSEICSRVHKQDGSLTDNAHMVKAALEILGLTVKQDDLSLIEPDHFIEMYGINHIQIFRSFSILENTTYTFEDLACRKWYHLYERAPKDHQKTTEKVMEFWGQKPPIRMAPGLGIQAIQEKASLENLVCISEIEWLIPLWKGDDFAGAMTLIRDHGRGAKTGKI
ncbi:hypothetical protein B9G69_009625 [Bdellovibrio sp. SKB1291214]|uniref:hypothetical protein n=1 Tax=Bdellovibrio sp. SKB1291214 TaxID=1732569 RepID=UPI000B5188D0|nr:hypothetical protein [Bdellovibrio sp. SKB1291214]UYL07304.1 hypothetical protein B9G69_009625 [Bdellovibrio sp. SKB1291214]